MIHLNPERQRKSAILGQHWFQLLVAVLHFHQILRMSPPAAQRIKIANFKFLASHKNLPTSHTCCYPKIHEAVPFTIASADLI
jgi:hypothetical protein